MTLFHWMAIGTLTHRPPMYLLYKSVLLRFHCRQLLVDLQNDRTGQVSIFLANAKLWAQKFKLEIASLMRI